MEETVTIQRNDSLPETLRHFARGANTEDWDQFQVRKLLVQAANRIESLEQQRDRAAERLGKQNAVLVDFFDRWDRITA